MSRNVTGEAEPGPLRLQFDVSVKLTFQGSSISSDGGLLLYRELDDALGLLDMTARLIADPRTGRNGRHRLAGLLRQSIFSRLAGYEDVNDANRAAPRSSDASACRRADGQARRGFGERHGPFRDRDVGPAGELGGSRRPAGSLDRRRTRPTTSEEHHTGHGQFRKPGAWRSGGCGVERALPVQVPAPAVRVQPVRRSRTVYAAARQRAQRRWLGRCAASGVVEVFIRRAAIDHTPEVPGPMRPSPSRRCSICWRPRAGTTPSASRATRSCTSGSRG